MSSLSLWLELEPNTTLHEAVNDLVSAARNMNVIVKAKFENLVIRVPPHQRLNSKMIVRDIQKLQKSAKHGNETVGEYCEILNEEFDDYENSLLDHVGEVREINDGVKVRFLLDSTDVEFVFEENDFHCKPQIGDQVQMKLVRVSS